VQELWRPASCIGTKARKGWPAPNLCPGGSALPLVLSLTVLLVLLGCARSYAANDRIVIESAFPAAAPVVASEAQEPLSSAVQSAPANAPAPMPADPHDHGLAEPSTQIGPIRRYVRKWLDESSDPVHPTNEFSIRNYYFNLRNGEYRDSVVFRLQASSAERVSIKAEFPISTAYRGSVHEYGTGDMYVEGTYAPWRTDYSGFAGGLGMSMPTASSSTLGSGQWQLAPIIFPVVYPLGDKQLSLSLRLRNFFSVARVGKFNFVSIAGDPDASELSGPNINYLEVTPAIQFALSENWSLYSEPVRVTVDWEKHNALGYRTAFRVAHLFTSQLGVWVQPEVPFGSNRTGDFNIKVSLFYRY
jgi:hypothetical protein